MPEILTEQKGGILRIQLHRPEKKNALTFAMYEALTAAFTAANGDAATRVVLLHGGPEAFTAGNDLKDFLAQPPSGFDAPALRFIKAIATCEKPVVAAVAGFATGIGTTILPYCDLVYAADNARFSTPFVDLGLVPEAGSSFTLPHQLGYHAAAELLLLGATFTAIQAQAVGLVNAVLPGDELLARATAAATALAAKPATALRTTKKLLRQGWQASAMAAYEAEGPLFVQMLTAPAAKEAFAAFLEKRKADFSKVG